MHLNLFLWLLSEATQVECFLSLGEVRGSVLSSVWLVCEGPICGVSMECLGLLRVDEHGDDVKLILSKE